MKRRATGRAMGRRRGRARTGASRRMMRFGRGARARRRGRAIAAGLTLALAVTPLAPPRAAEAQLPPVPEAIEELDFLVGEWEGDGWIEGAPGQRATFRGTEKVERRMGGRLVVVEGDFIAVVGPDGREAPVHQALGIFSYDRERDALRFRTYLARGTGGVHDVERFEPDERRLRWGYEDPRMGTVRYTIEITPEGEWHEIGEARRGDEAWQRFFEMTLTRR